ncbi:signal peptidase I [Microbacterium elymi]|uniref:signal peptidase I n=1 Tax=Microbacterium elymi TaxID=2909587 RepID=UPI003F4933C6
MADTHHERSTSWSSFTACALAVLWTLAVAGVACGLVWGATAAGLIKPLIVISGSMEPGIMTGDLVVDTPVAADTLAPGDVVSLPNALTHDLVTHRIESIAAHGEGYTITLKGDNNEFADAVDYQVGAEVWAPKVQLAGAGALLQRLMAPGVMIALLVGVLALIAFTWMTPATRPEPTPTPTAPAAGSRRERRTLQEATAP